MKKLWLPLAIMAILSEHYLTNIKPKGGEAGGSRGATSRDNDYIEYIFVTKTHNYLLLFTDRGKCYWLNVYEIPEGEKNTKGRSIRNLMQLEQDESVRAFVSVEDLQDEEYVNSRFIVFATKKGLLKKTSLEAYSRPRQGGIIAININEGDELLEALLTDGNSEIMLGTTYGQAIRFPENKVRAMGRTATGVIGVRLGGEDDQVVGLLAIHDLESTIMVVSEKGFGKRSLVEDYRVTNRGGKGIRTMSITEKTGRLIAIGSIYDNEEVMIICKSGITIRMDMSNIRVMGRSTQGVRLIRLTEGDEISSVTRVVIEDENEDENGAVTDGEVSETDEEENDE